VMTLATIDTYITLDGSLSSWWTKIAIGVLMFGFVGLQKLLSISQGIRGFKQRKKPDAESKPVTPVTSPT